MHIIGLSWDNLDILCTLGSINLHKIASFTYISPYIRVRTNTPFILEFSFKEKVVVTANVELMMDETFGLRISCRKSVHSIYELDGRYSLNFPAGDDIRATKPQTYIIYTLRRGYYVCSKK